MLDEADEMLDMEFGDDIDAILAVTPPDRALLRHHAAPDRRHDLRDPVCIHIGRQQLDPGQVPLVRQVAYVVARAHKPAALGRVLDVESPAAGIVFCRTRDEVDRITKCSTGGLSGRGPARRHDTGAP